MADFRQTQQQLTAWLREPDANAPPAGIEPRRLKIYSELVFNNIEGFLSSGFPVCRSLFAEDEWQSVVRDFLIRHRCHSPYFHEICQEFMAFLQQGNLYGRPWLLELAHYEWTELELDISEDEASDPNTALQGSLLTGAPVVSPHVRSLGYQWPVHLIGPDSLPEKPQPVYLLVYRNRADAIEFMELNAATARLLALMMANDRAEPRSGADLLTGLAQESGHPDPAALRAFAVEILEDFRRRGVLLGARPLP